MHKPDYPALSRAIAGFQRARQAVRGLPSERASEDEVLRELRQARLALEAFEDSLYHPRGGPRP